MKLTILGSGSPEAYARRASSGYLLEVGTDKILFDVGGGVVDNLLRAGLRPGDITHLYLSHLHSDHMMDYARLVHAAWDEGAPPLKVFGPAPIARITELLFAPGGVFDADLRARTELPQSQQVWTARGGTLPRPWPAPDVTEIGYDHCHDHGGWQIKAAEAAHAQPILTCMGFAVTAGEKRFVYSGDTGLTDQMAQLCTGADLLLHWCYRHDDAPASPEMAMMTPTPSEIAAMAERMGAKRLILTHFREHMDAQPVTLKTNVTWSVAEDLQSFEV